MVELLDFSMVVWVIGEWGGVDLLLWFGWGDLDVGVMGGDYFFWGGFV